MINALRFPRFGSLHLLCLLGLLASALEAGPRIIGPPDHDGDDVRRAAAAFYQSIADSNADAAHALFVGPEDQAALVDAELGVVAASKRMSRVMQARFGGSDPNRKNPSAGAIFLRLVARQSQAMIVLNGDEASVAGAMEPDNGLGLRRIAGRWKVIRATLHDCRTATARRYFTLLTSGIDDVRTQVESGRIKTAEVAYDELGKVLYQARRTRPTEPEDLARPAATLPTPSPAPPFDKLQSLLGRHLLSPEVAGLIDSLPCTPSVFEYESAVFVEAPEIGMDLSFGLPAGRLRAVHLYGGVDNEFSRYTGAPPSGLAFGQARIDIERRFGRPASLFGSDQTGVTAEYPQLKLLIGYGPGPQRNPRAPIARFTLVVPELMSGATTRPFNQAPAVLSIRAVLDEQEPPDADRVSDPLDPTGVATLRISRQPIIAQDQIANAHLQPDESGGGMDVGLDLTPEGGRRLSQATEKMIGRRVAIMLGSRILMAPVVRSKIADHVQIDFGKDGTPADADKLIHEIGLAMLSLPADSK